MPVDVYFIDLNVMHHHALSLTYLWVAQLEIGEDTTEDEEQAQQSEDDDTDSTDDPEESGEAYYEVKCYLSDKHQLCDLACYRVNKLWMERVRAQRRDCCVLKVLLEAEANLTGQVSMLLLYLLCPQTVHCSTNSVQSVTAVFKTGTCRLLFGSKTC